MKKGLALILALLLMIPLAFAEDAADWEDEDEYYDEEFEQEWRAYWEEYGYFDVFDLQGDTLIVREGVTALGAARTWAYDEETDEEIEIEPAFEDGYSLECWSDPPFRRVSLPDSFQYLGIEAFYAYDFDEFTLPAQLKILEMDAFTYCSFGVLRIEAELPPDMIREGLDDCTVMAYEVPADHPLYKTVDGALLSRDGKTLYAYPNGRTDAHWDVPAGVERIECRAFDNEYLKTLSLPIGLQSIADYGLAGCTRLQAIALPLTVRELGRNVFFGCVSLELVSLPEGLEAEQETRWVEYYPDDSLFRGDNGDTLGGARGEGRIDAPGRVFSAGGPDRSNMEQTHVRVYDSAAGDGVPRWYRNGKIVYMGRYEGGRVALYEPLGGNYGGNGGYGYGSVIGWVDLADVQYLPQETLFAWAEVRPRGQVRVWWNHLPDYASWVPWETVIPQDRKYVATLFGPYARFRDASSGAAFACRVEEAGLRRAPDGTDNVYGIVFKPEISRHSVPLLGTPGGQVIRYLSGGTSARLVREEGDWAYIYTGGEYGYIARDRLSQDLNAASPDIPLRDAPEGDIIKYLMPGTQVQILQEQDIWRLVTDGKDTGWVEDEQVLVIPE